MNMQQNRVQIIFFTSLLCSVFFLASCGREKIFFEYQPIDEAKGWDRNDKKIFQPTIEDTLGVYNIYVHVRNADNYPYRNLFIFLTTDYPDGQREIDTLECLLADEKNRWLGSGAGDLWDNAILLKADVQFPMKGKYRFTFEQGMRINPVPLILDVGLSIEKPEKK
jgi:gliding motility-associated lipoprotein GldH